MFDIRISSCRNIPEIWRLTKRCISCLPSLGIKAHYSTTVFSACNWSKNPVMIFVTHAGIVNKHCEKFKLQSLTEDQFKCLIFACSLTSPCDAQSRTRFLAKLEQDPDITLQSITTDCLQLINLKKDAAMIEQQSSSRSEPFTAVSNIESMSSDLTTYAINKARPATSPNYQQSSVHKPPSRCRYCGEWHFHRDCPFRYKRCFKCNQVGHKAGYCHSKTGYKQPKAGTFKPRVRQIGTSSRNQENMRSLSVRCPIKRKPVSRRRYTSVHINGNPVRLQLDTASDITVISEKTWHAIGRPPIFPASQPVTSASGDPIHFIGRGSVRISFRQKSDSGTLFVTDRNLDVLGLDWFDKLGLADLSINAICDSFQLNRTNSETSDDLARYPEVFYADLGRYKTTQFPRQLARVSQPASRSEHPCSKSVRPLVENKLRNQATRRLDLSSLPEKQKGEETSARTFADVCQVPQVSLQGNANFGEFKHSN